MCVMGKIESVQILKIFNKNNKYNIKYDTAYRFEEWGGKLWFCR